ncbi:hypothetical protein [Methanothermobacter sp.]|uniref:hypothetical protein n=1 Tax=Methanothermobacter sp. TaxID=1884223 RepID=UPI0026364645|nr:hypothetical protein [Methanothermobacter sp.]MDI9617570.1 hypothetical protein [Methanothermobacter sp.]
MNFWFPQSIPKEPGVSYDLLVVVSTDDGLYIEGTWDFIGGMWNADSQPTA